MRRCYGWVVVGPDGTLLIWTLRIKRLDAIRRFRASAFLTWRHWYRRGIRCVKVELRLVEKPKRKGGGRVRS